MDISFLFLIFILSTVGAGLLTNITIGLDLIGIEIVCCPSILAFPIALALFFLPAFVKRVKPFQRYLFPGLIYPIIFGIILGYMIYDQSPRVMFKRLLGEPIPSGITDIRTDIYTDLSYYEKMAFNATPEAIDEIIARNNLVLIDRSDCEFRLPFKDYKGASGNKGWLCYSVAGDEPNLWGWLYVSSDKSVVQFQFHIGN
jgi:hypothetical protein